MVDRELQELHRREKVYRGTRPWPILKGRCVILVDDGLATGATMRAAIKAVKQHEAGKIIMAVPVASAQALFEVILHFDQTTAIEPLDSTSEWIAGEANTFPFGV